LLSHQVRCFSLASTVFHSDEKGVQEGAECGKAAAKAADPPKIKRGTTPIGKLDELEEGNHPFQEKEPLKAHPGGVNPGSNKIYFWSGLTQIQTKFMLEQQNPSWGLNS
jgi:hypothetical protein